MRTQAQIEASRRNGAKSNGPKTDEGRTRSSQNAIKHGLSAHKFVVLEGESEDGWAEFHQGYIAKFQPRERPYWIGPNHPGMIDDCLELRSGFSALARRQKSDAARINRIKSSANGVTRMRS
jgi:hypothetical protein